MVKKTVVIILLILFPFVSSVGAEEKGLTISGPFIKTEGARFTVSFELKATKQYSQSIRQSLTKEFNVYVDLFRHWGIWPDEFIKGKKYVRTLSIDPIKKEFVGGSFDGEVYLYKRFKGFESLLKWFLTFDKALEESMVGLEPGRYYVKVTVESKKSGLSSLISNILILLPVHDLKIEKSSPYLLWDGKILRVER